MLLLSGLLHNRHPEPFRNQGWFAFTFYFHCYRGFELPLIGSFFLGAQKLKPSSDFIVDLDRIDKA